MKRRTFIKNTAASATLLSLGGMALSCDKQNAKKITILHTNDVHSHIDPFGPNDGRNANKGGYQEGQHSFKNSEKKIQIYFY